MDDYLLGIDISKHQGDVDHLAVAQSGMLWCICKASEGRNYEDPKFEQNITQIRSVLEQGYDYFPGAYHFARPDSDGGDAADGMAEAEDFCDIVERVCGDILESFMPPVLDFEKYSESDKDENIPWIEAWVEVVQRRLGREPMIYTGANVWRYEVGNTSAFTYLPLWQVYYSGTAENPPAMPWPTWTMWQYSGGGSYAHHPPVPGVGIVDVNRWHGTFDQLKLFARAAVDPPPVSPSWPTPPEQLNLNDLRGQKSEYVSRVQGLLLSYGYGPDGLVSSSTGLPDGLMGNKTEGYLRDFKTKHMLPGDALMDWDTWWALVYDKLR